MHLHTAPPTIADTGRLLLRACEGIDAALTAANVIPLGVSITRTSVGHTLIVTMRSVPDLNRAGVALDGGPRGKIGPARNEVHHILADWQGIPVTLTATAPRDGAA